MSKENEPKKLKISFKFLAELETKAAKQRRSTTFRANPRGRFSPFPAPYKRWNMARGLRQPLYNGDQCFQLGIE